MKEEIRKELEETTVETIKHVRASIEELSTCCELRENCAAIGILVDTLLRLEEVTLRYTECCDEKEPHK